MNMVVITAALSSANTNLYLTTRTLFSLSRDGYVSETLGLLARNGVPYFALLASIGGMVAAILLAIFAPGRAFLLLYGVAVAGMFFVWIIILLAHLAFRRSLGPCARRSATDPLAILALLANRRPDRSRRDHDQHLLRRGAAIHGAKFHAVPPGNHSVLLGAEAKQGFIDVVRIPRGTSHLSQNRLIR